MTHGRSKGRVGGFSYQPGHAPGFARTAAGVCILQLTGEYKAKEIGKAIDFLDKNFDAREHFWYGHYYASHAMHQVGGKEWRSWYDRMLRRFGRLEGHAEQRERERSLAVQRRRLPKNGKAAPQQTERDQEDVTRRQNDAALGKAGPKDFFAWKQVGREPH